MNGEENSIFILDGMLRRRIL